MPKFFFRQKMNLAELGQEFKLSSYHPSITLDGLQTGIDNVRTDVSLSDRFADAARAHLARLIAKHGAVEDLVKAAGTRSGMAATGGMSHKSCKPHAEAPEFKTVLTDLHLAALTRAKAEGNLAIDLLARLAVMKFLRSELLLQFNAVLEKCRGRLNSYEGPLQANAPTTIDLRDRIARFQVGKKPLLRTVGQEIFQTLREVDKETLARTRWSLFGDSGESAYELLENRLLFTEDGRDDVINAQHYVMLGNFERDPDRFHHLLQLAREFLKSLQAGHEHGDDEGSLDALLSVPENIDELMGGGATEPVGARRQAQQQVLQAWAELLEREGVLVHLMASYEIAALLAEYSPPINPQQLKQAVIWQEERRRVEDLMEQHGKLSPTSLHAAIRHVARCSGAERSKVAARFLRDFVRYHRDLRRLHATTAAMDGINLITSGKLRELSSINHSLYEFLLTEEQKPATAQVIHHVVLKADIRDSSQLTRTLFERGLNPASYFSLNFYEPVNKLLPKYGASKLFIEGDAVILALFEREGDPEFGVARACVLAREIIGIVSGYNQKSQEAGLPTLELGIGICYQDSAPMYLMDGTQQIMISPALNESDRLSSCSRSARKLFAGVESLFNVYCFQTIDDADAAGQTDEFLMRYNIGGINLNEAGFEKLRQEISLELHSSELPMLWDQGPVRLYSGMVPVGPGVFHKIVIRESRVPHIEAREFQLKQWTDRKYYEVCTNESIYEFVSAMARGNGA